MIIDPKKNDYPFPNNPVKDFDTILAKSYTQWSNYDFIQLRLMNHKEILTFLKKKKIIIADDVQFKYFLMFLNDLNIVHPMVKCIQNSKFYLSNKRKNTFTFYHKIPNKSPEENDRMYQEFLNHSIFFYHPFQVLDIMNQLINTNLLKSQLFKQYERLSDCLYRPEIFLHPRSIKYGYTVESVTSQAKQILEDHARTDSSKTLIQKATTPKQLLTFYSTDINIGKSMRTIFQDSMLAVMIKLWQVAPDNFHFGLSSEIWKWKLERSNPIDDLDRQKWAEMDVWIQNHQNETYLEEPEKKIVEQYSGKGLYQGKNIYDSFPTHNFQKIYDVFEIMNPSKIEDLTGNLWLSWAVVKFQKEIERIYWALYKKPLKDRGGSKPYFFLDPRSEALDYKLSVLNKFGLLPENFYVLWVEGQTEKDIMDTYLQFGSHLLPYFPIITRNMSGADEIPHLSRFINKDILRNFIFFDFDTQDAFDRRTKNLPENSFAAFSPDFITENFSIKKILSYYQKMLAEFSFSIPDLEALKQQLGNKSIEKELKDNFKTQYYDIGSNRLMICDRINSQEHLKKYRQFVTQRENDGTLEIKNFESKDNRNKNMTNFIKTYLSQYICHFLKDYYKKRRDSSDKAFKKEFPFEVKFRDFYKIMRDHRERNSDMQYGHMNPDDDKMSFTI